MKTIIMKTKNILKIGVFSIVILSFIISSVLKSNAAPLNEDAEKVPCESQNGICREKCIIVSQGEAEYIEVPDPSLFCADNKICCKLASTEEVKTILAEASAADICKGVGGAFESIWFSLDWFEHLFCVIQKMIIEGLGKMFAAVMNLQVGMILWAFNPATYGGFVNNDAVQNVWTFIRDLINLALVLGLVFIAIATILGIKKYSWQQTLWKLVVVALLVNFSLVIAGMILDVSNFFAYSLLNQAKINNKSIAESMISSLETETLTSGKEYEIAGVSGITQTATKGWGLSLGNGLIATVCLILIGLFAVIALLAVFLAMIFRSFIIVVLLCFTPIAFAAWIFPDTEKYWKMWWEQFIKWCTFPIIFGFMLWMGVYAVNNLGITQISSEGASFGMIPFFVRVFLFSMFLVGGLIFSIQGGGAASQFVMKQGSKVALGLGSAIAGSAIGRVTTSGWYDNLAHRLSAEGAGARGGVTGFLSRGLSNQLYMLKGVTQAKQKEKEEKELAKISDEAALTNAARNAMALGKTETTLRILAIKAKRNLAYAPDERHFMLRLQPRFQHTENARDVYKYNSALRLDDQGNRIPMDEIVNRYKTTPIDQTNVRELIQSLEDRNLQQQFIEGALGPARSIRELADFIQTIPAGHQRDFMDFIHQNILGRSLRNYLADPNVNPRLVRLIEQPASNTSTQDMSRISLIVRLWNF